jgi:uncharacterized membrane protein YcaP (DUF421 family)
MSNALDIFLRTAGVYLFIILALRLFGKKELTQLSVFDLVFILLISNSVQNAMVGPDSSLLGGLIAAATLFILNSLLKSLAYRLPRINRLLQGHPVMLIHKGEILTGNLAKEKISLEELHTALREHGVEDPGQVDLAVLETDGSISVMSDSYRRHTVRRRRAHKAITKNQ